MFSRVGIPVLALAVLATAACGGGPGADEPPVTPGAYVDLAQEALQGPSRMTAIVGRQGGPRPPAAPERMALDRIVADAERARERLADAPIEDPGLRAQRDALVTRQAAIVGVMRRLVDPLARGDRATVRAQAPALVLLMRRLPSDVAAASPSS
jgi:hypothetical protein